MNGEMIKKQRPPIYKENKNKEDSASLEAREVENPISEEIDENEDSKYPRFPIPDQAPMLTTNTKQPSNIRTNPNFRLTQV
jgi:hypothetical protein